MNVTCEVWHTSHALPNANPARQLLTEETAAAQKPGGEPAVLPGVGVGAGAGVRAGATRKRSECHSHRGAGHWSRRSGVVVRLVMRVRWFVSVIALTAGGSGLVGCFHNFEDCKQNPTLACFSFGDGGSGGSGGGAGGVGGAPQECIPGVASAPVDDSCGVFVSAVGSDTNEGTKAAPFATLAKAVSTAKGNPVYACTDGFSEALVLSEDATIYGGVDCSQGWKYVGLATLTPWTAGADEVPLLVATGARAKLEDIAVTAADAVKDGGSSIVVLAQVGSQLDLARCDVSAGNGADGAAGDTPAEPVTNGADGKPGKDACISDSDQTGGSSAVLSCDGISVSSGGGGNGTTSIGGDGSKGQPINAATGLAGAGQIDAANTCTAGGDGAAGTTGEAGLGAPMTLGTLGPSGYAGVAANDGKPGLPGQGAGGGGGAKACATIKVNGNVAAGASGGSGGSGACGGAGGKGGKAGGSSIGIAAVGAKLLLDSVHIATQAGGSGGSGGDGQSGGSGGKAGAAGKANDGSVACAGGKGGAGGIGGKGGGGLGGHSIGIAHTGEAPEVTGATITTGAPGEGGPADGDTGSGASGVAAQVQAF